MKKEECKTAEEMSDWNDYHDNCSRKGIALFTLEDVRPLIKTADDMSYWNSCNQYMRQELFTREEIEKFKVA